MRPREKEEGEREQGAAAASRHPAVGAAGVAPASSGTGWEGSLGRGRRNQGWRVGIVMRGGDT